MLQQPQCTTQTVDSLCLLDSKLGRFDLCCVPRAASGKLTSINIERLVLAHGPLSHGLLICANSGH